MEHNYYSQQSSTPAGDARDSLSSAAADFSKNVQEATSKLVNAAESFATMSTGLNEAINEVKSASTKAQDAQKAAEEAKTAAEAIQAKIDRDYGNLRSLMGDLQERIGALAVLARPLSIDPVQESTSSVSDDNRDEHASSSNQDASPAVENAPSPAGWQGWQG
ncbi:MAG: hypothetical protein AB7P33_18595 [Dehalococcoidia bacterium]